MPGALSSHILNIKIVKVEDLKIGEKTYPFYLGMSAIRNITEKHKVPLAALGGFISNLSLDMLVSFTQEAIKQGSRLRKIKTSELEIPSDYEILDGIDLDGKLLTKIPSLIGDCMSRIFPDDKKEESGADENPAPEKK